MKLLKEVKCNINNDTLVGKIVIKENGMVEGIVVDIRNMEKYLIFGAIEHNYINFTAIDRNNKVYTSKLNLEDKKYKGELYYDKGNRKNYIGNCNVSIIEPDRYRDVNEGEIKGLLLKTHFLITEMNNLGNIYYNKYSDKDNNKVLSKGKK